MQIESRFSSPYRVGNHVSRKLLTTRTEVRQINGGAFRVLLADGSWLKNAGGAARSFKTFDKAAVAAIEHAGG